MIGPAQAKIKALAHSGSASVLAKYYSPPECLNATQIFIPGAYATELPKIFGMEGKVKPGLLVMHYKGKVTAPRSGTFRFVGKGDDFLIVRFGGTTVLDASMPGWPPIIKEAAVDDTVGAAEGAGKLMGGKWINVEAGHSYEMEVILGDIGFGGSISAFLLIQEKGVEYSARSKGSTGPLLPVFKIGTNTPLPPYKKNINGPEVAPAAIIFK